MKPDLSANRYRDRVLLLGLLSPLCLTLPFMQKTWHIWYLPYLIWLVLIGIAALLQYLHKNDEL